MGKALDLFRNWPRPERSTVQHDDFSTLYSDQLEILNRPNPTGMGGLLASLLRYHHTGTFNLSPESFREDAASRTRVRFGWIPSHEHYDGVLMELWQEGVAMAAALNLSNPDRPIELRSLSLDWRGAETPLSRNKCPVRPGTDVEHADTMPYLFATCGWSLIRLIFCNSNKWNRSTVCRTELESGRR